MKGILECCRQRRISQSRQKRRSRQTGTLSGTCDRRVTLGTALFQEIKNQMDIRIHALMRPRF